MTRPHRAPADLAGIRLIWYPLGLVPIALFIGLPVFGLAPVLLLQLGLFLLFFWIFSLGFAIYAKFQSRPQRQSRQATPTSKAARQ